MHQSGAWCSSQWRWSSATQRSYQQPASGHADESLQTFFPFFYPLSLSLSGVILLSLLISMLIEYSDWMWEWLHRHGVARSLSLPSSGYFGEVEKLWLTPGRNPLATAIYRERDTVTFASGAYERQKYGERMREKKHEGYSQFFENINNLSRNPSHFFPGQIKEEKRSGVWGKKKGGNAVAGCKKKKTLSRFFFLAQKWKKKRNAPWNKTGWPKLN